MLNVSVSEPVVSNTTGINTTVGTVPSHCRCVGSCCDCCNCRCQCRCKRHCPPPWQMSPWNPFVQPVWQWPTPFAPTITCGGSLADANTAVAV